MFGGATAATAMMLPRDLAGLSGVLGVCLIFASVVSFAQAKVSTTIFVILYTININYGILL